MRLGILHFGLIALALLPWLSAHGGQTAGIYNVMDYGAVGDGTANDTAAVQKAIDACNVAGGGQVVLPSGKVFLTGVIRLKSNVDFHLANNAVLKGSADWRDYGHEGALIFAENASNLTISGDGTIDGNDLAVWKKLADEQAGGDVNKPNWWPNSFVGDYMPWGKTDPTQPGGRPMMMILIGCKHLRLRDFTLRGAPSWTLHPIGCQDTLIQDIAIHNSWDVPNNDGIDIDHCQDMRIVGCSIDCADDTIVIKNTPNFAQYGGDERITVTGCTLASRSAALKIDECYAPPGARDIIFADCTISRSNRGLCIQSRDAGDIENVIFSNIVVQTQFWADKWWGAAEVIDVTLFPRTPETKLGHVRNIQFNNILCRGESGAFLQGWPGHPLENISLSNVQIEMAKIGKVQGGFYDLRPAGIFKGVYEAKLAGIYARQVDHLSLAHTRVIWDDGLDDCYGKGFDSDALSNLLTDHVDFPDFLGH